VREGLSVSYTPRVAALCRWNPAMARRDAKCAVVGRAPRHRAQSASVGSALRKWHGSIARALLNVGSGFSRTCRDFELQVRVGVLCVRNTDRRWQRATEPACVCKDESSEAGDLVSRIRNSVTYSGRGIPAGGVAPPSHVPNMLSRRAWPSGCRAPEYLSPNS
jgi:hypothetical protein